MLFGFEGQIDTVQNTGADAGSFSVRKQDIYYKLNILKYLKQQMYKFYQNINSLQHISFTMKNQIHDTKVLSYPGVNILVIYDPEAVKSSCAISVNVGSIDQPDQVPGLAHLLEHMIFVSSKAYPKPNQYSQFLTSHSGYQNAQTCDFYTNYYLEAPNQAFQEAIQRVSDAFCNPLLSSDHINSEIEAIHQEFVLSGSEDDDRLYQINNSLCNPPLCRFSMGNRQTLSIPGIEAQLFEFHEKYRTDSQINIILYCQKPLKNIQKFQKFSLKYSEQKLSGKLENIFDFEAFPQKNTNKFINLTSILSGENIKIELILNLSKNEKIKKEFKQCSSYHDKLKYLQNLSQFNIQFHACLEYILCHESDSVSLISYLEKFQEIEEIDFDIEEIVPFTQHMLTITLHIEQQTYPGQKKIEKIHDRVMQYLSQYINIENIHRAFKQVSYLADLEQRNLQIDDMEDYLCDLARMTYQVGVDNLFSSQKMDNKNILTESQQLLQWAIKEICSGSNKIIIQSSPNEPKGQIKTQPNLKALYSIKQLTYSTKPTPKQNILKSLIPPNPLLPLKQKIYPSINNPYSPILLSQNIHFYNTSSKIMKGGIKLLLHNDEGYVFNKLFCQFMDLYFEDVENNGAAETVGVEYFFDYQQGSLYLYLYGYNQLVVYILEQVGKKMTELIKSLGNYEAKNNQDLNDTFDQAVQNLLQQLQDYYQQEIDYLTDKIRDQVLIQTTPPLNVIQKQVNKIKKNKFLQKCAAIISQSVLQWIVVGNFDHQEIQKVVHEFQQALENSNKLRKQGNQKVQQIKVMRTENLPLDKKIKLEVRHKSQQIKTSTCLSYFEGGVYSQKLFWILEILCQYLDEPFYSHIRFLKKLSYDFEINLVNTRGILGVCFMLTSSKIDPERISKQIEEFLEKYAKNEVLQEKLKENYEKIKKALIVKYSEPFCSVEDCFDFICDEVVNRSFYFELNNHEHIRQKLQTISIEDVLKIANKIFKGPCIQILFVSKEHKKSYFEQKPKITPLDQIKKNAEYYKDNLSSLSFSFKKQ